MSTSSKPKSRAPAHNNSIPFRHNKGSKLTARIEQTAHTNGLCNHCKDKIEWRKKYRKYKPLTNVRKCNKCGGKSIKAAYRTVCGPCARKDGGICEGCGKNKARGKVTEEEDIEEIGVQAVVEGLEERKKRTVRRRVEKGENIVDVMADVLGVGEGESEEEAEEEEDVDG